MKDEGKKESIGTRIKNFFKRLFKRNKVIALPKNTDEVLGTKEKVKIIKEEPIKVSKSKEEYINLYKDVKDKKVDINTLDEEDLMVFIQLAKQELNFISKRLDEETTRGNMYDREIQYYKEKISKMSN